MSDVTRLVGGMSYKESPEPSQGAGGVRLPFITLSRQAGAGANRLGQVLLEAMQGEQDQGIFGGWQIYDEKLCEELLRSGHFKVSMESLLSEEYHSQIEEFVSGIFGNRTDQNLVIQRMFHTIRTLATIGKAIIIGRAGSHVTQGLSPGVHVRLVADADVRAERMAKMLGQGEREARQTIRTQDRDRERLIRTYFNADINDPLLYDLTCNMGTVSFEAAAQAIIALIKDRVTAARASAA